jgi:hypothetical protein
VTDQARLQEIRQRADAALEAVERGFSLDPVTGEWYAVDVPWLLGALDAAHAENQRYREALIAARRDLAAVNVAGDDTEVLEQKLDAIDDDLGRALAGLPDTSEEGQR